MRHFVSDTSFFIIDFPFFCSNFAANFKNNVTYEKEIKTPHSTSASTD